MRKLVTAAALAASIALAGCGTIGAIPVVGPIVTAPAVISIATTLCPTVTGIVIADVESLISANPLVDPNTLANWVCRTFLGASNASARYRARLGGAIPVAVTVGGVVIHRQ